MAKYLTKPSNTYTMEPLNMQQVISLYNRFKESSDGTVHPIRKYFLLPDCDWCVRMAHKLWAKIQLAHGYQSKFPALAKQEVSELNKMVEAIVSEDLTGLHKRMKKLDEVFDNVH